MKLSFEVKRIIYAAVFPFLFVLFLWLIEALMVGMNWDLSFFGINPRTWSGGVGILFHYLIHSDFEHLWSNTFPLLILGWFLFYFYKEIAWRTIGFLWMFTGILLWLIGRQGVHVGASGLIYALAFFLIFSGIFRAYSPLLAVSLTVVFLYGSMTWGIFPFSELIKPNMSWEGHLSGACSGLLAAVVFRKQGPQKPLPIDNEDEGDEENEENDDVIPPWSESAFLGQIKVQDHSRSLPKDDNEPTA